MKIKPIIVSGVPRSGTTWLARIISYSKYYYYIDEIINPDGGLYKNSKPFDWFQYIDDSNFENFEKYFNNIFNYKYPIESIRIDKKVKKFFINRMFLLKKNIFGYPQPLLKDPELSFSLETISKNYNCKIVVIVRHPCAVVSSFKRMNWNVDFTPILAQNILKNKYLTSFIPLIKSSDKKNIVENVSILWLVIMHSISKMLEKNKNWILVRHEDLSSNPVNEFKKLFTNLNIPYDKKIINKILNTTKGDYVLPPNNETFYMKRNSKYLIDYWKTTLDSKDIMTIKNITKKYLNLYY